jgi:hypothetical protein
LGESEAEMAEVIQEFTSQFHDENNAHYSVLAYGERSVGGLWEAWIEFHPVDETRSVMRTERETTQPNKPALEYWASGLEPLYFEGAFIRARPK